MTLVHLLKLPLLWFSKERPSAVLSPFASGPCPHLCEETDNRCLTAKPNTPSVPVVLPDCNGLLRKWLRRFVAPYFQPWGSSRFQHNLPFAASLQPSVPRAFPRLAYRTLRSFSLRNSRTVSPQSLPSRRCSLPLFPVTLTRPQGFAPSRSPFPNDDVAIIIGLDAPLGFVPLQGSPLKLECSSEVLRSHPAEAVLL